DPAELIVDGDRDESTVGPADRAAAGFDLVVGIDQGRTRGAGDDAGRSTQLDDAEPLQCRRGFGTRADGERGAWRFERDRYAIVDRAHKRAGFAGTDDDIATVFDGVSVTAVEHAVGQPDVGVHIAGQGPAEDGGTAGDEDFGPGVGGRDRA